MIRKEYVDAFGINILGRIQSDILSLKNMIEHGRAWIQVNTIALASLTETTTLPKVAQVDLVAHRERETRIMYLVAKLPPVPEVSKEENESTDAEVFRVHEVDDDDRESTDRFDLSERVWVSNFESICLEKLSSLYKSLEQIWRVRVLLRDLFRSRSIVASVK
ncbi:putative LRR receptor-like serine/threonine-protein kinase [Dorcoceras hygrometricum]|uniref:Putative LRR receptor-like serine/threonine-protein kinase n=1 Tax=Dorcoceras hygrometricum TaxID=472368 RepID=A0A2Z7AX83_9LAMI|nr:putative LRR receptor-like serine/threonine-protein kinase [Dorcoceras hygrometricum]